MAAFNRIRSKDSLFSTVERGEHTSTGTTYLHTRSFGARDRMKDSPIVRRPGSNASFAHDMITRVRVSGTLAKE
jgi:hypothetical protein